MSLQTIPEASANSYRTQQRLTAAAVLAARRSWAAVDPDAIDESWAATSPALAGVLTRLQGAAAADAAGAVPLALADQGVSVDPIHEIRPRAVAGFAGQGYEPTTVFQSAPIAAKARIGAGVEPVAALAVGGRLLTGIVETAMADAGRQGAALAIHARPKVGYVRMLNPPSCSRCAILAGKPSRREPFLRHPRCDCRAIPSMEDLYDNVTFNQAEYFGSLTGAEQDRIFTKAGAQAIRDGADMAQVVNARRGMSTVQTPGSQRWLVTNEGMTRRGYASWRMQQAGLGEYRKTGGRYRRMQTQRLMPETIYEVARDQEHASQLLRMYGYIR
ncbi:hypothetical protein M3F63_07060 [Brachybacterium muris]|uniref:hypothetical protein n=1 Tax=Brachybacterium muris TaxID=219301 RepID=UPI00223B65FB|nr:hypothetical protein [Brachybacterium muris]MCT2177427.1 hypothetical protein [Brachybacterium muris]